MVDKTDIKKIVYAYDQLDVQNYLDAGWVIIETAPGKNEDGSAYILTMLGQI